jgi:hypothetical protein
MHQGAVAFLTGGEDMTENAHLIVEALALICAGPKYDGRGVPTDRPYAYAHRRMGAWAYARSTSGLFVAVVCADASLPTCDKNIDRHLAVKRNPLRVTTAGRLRGWLGGLTAGGFTLARFGYTVFELGEPSSALQLPFVADGDVAHVHAPVEEFYRVDRMRRRYYVMRQKQSPGTPRPITKATTWFSRAFGATGLVFAELRTSVLSSGVEHPRP